MLYTMPVALSIERWIKGASVAARAAVTALSEPEVEVVAMPTPSIAEPEGRAEGRPRPSGGADSGRGDLSDFSAGIKNKVAFTPFESHLHLP